MSNRERYVLKISEEDGIFRFISQGPKGDIKKIIGFTNLGANNVFNLEFGDVKEDGTTDDSIVNDNKDRNKVLATVANAVLYFTEHHPDCYIHFAGSTSERTWLYRMAITINYEELTRDFHIWGLTEEIGYELFEKGHVYNAFMIKRK